MMLPAGPVVPPGDHAVPRSRTVDLRWNALLNDFRRSGLTQAEFCRRRQISLHSFRKHLYQPRRPGPPPAIIVPPPLPTTTSSRSPSCPIRPRRSPIPRPHLELILPNGRRIAVAPGFDPQTLRRLIAAVEETPCSD